ncbi:hypothetical protein HDU76_008276 [Blyttiomyces sp. JEL0837]|nr:hypothetical protein HDU76_008276 [Blyttiomyces sp. JEL0837]
MATDTYHSRKKSTKKVEPTAPSSSTTSSSSSSASSPSKKRSATTADLPETTPQVPKVIKTPPTPTPSFAVVSATQSADGKRISTRKLYNTLEEANKFIQERWIDRFCEDYEDYETFQLYRDVDGGFTRFYRKDTKGNIADLYSEPVYAGRQWRLIATGDSYAKERALFAVIEATESADTADNKRSFTRKTFITLEDANKFIMDQWNTHCEEHERYEAFQLCRDDVAGFLRFWRKDKEGNHVDIYVEPASDGRWWKLVGSGGLRAIGHDYTA